MLQQAPEPKFALTPKGGPPRLIRFEPLPYKHLLSSLDETTNVLSIDPEQFDLLDNTDRHRLIRTLHRWNIVDKSLAMVPLEHDPAQSLTRKEAI